MVRRLITELPADGVAEILAWHEPWYHPRFGPGRQDWPRSFPQGCHQVYVWDYFSRKSKVRVRLVDKILDKTWCIDRKIFERSLTKGD